MECVTEIIMCRVGCKLGLFQVNLFCDVNILLIFRLTLAIVCHPVTSIMIYS